LKKYFYEFKFSDDNTFLLLLYYALLQDFTVYTASDMITKVRQVAKNRYRPAR